MHAPMGIADCKYIIKESIQKITENLSKKITLERVKRAFLTVTCQISKTFLKKFTLGGKKGIFQQSHEA